MEPGDAGHILRWSQVLDRLDRVDPQAAELWREEATLIVRQPAHQYADNVVAVSIPVTFPQRARRAAWTRRPEAVAMLAPHLRAAGVLILRVYVDPDVEETAVDHLLAPHTGPEPQRQPPAAPPPLDPLVPDLSDLNDPAVAWARQVVDNLPGGGPALLTVVALARAFRAGVRWALENKAPGERLDGG